MFRNVFNKFRLFDTVFQERLFNTTFLPSNSLDNPDDYSIGCIQHNNTQDQEPQVCNLSHNHRHLIVSSIETKKKKNTFF